MRVTVTRFFRDPPIWSALKATVLPRLASSLAPGQRFRAWSAGCAGGEEAYTLAMVWSVLPKSATEGRGLEVLGTDIDERVLLRARGARYDAAAVRKVPRELHDRSFSEEAPDSWRIDAALRECVHFERSDLLIDPPRPRQQLVLCRYLAFTYYRGQRLRATTERLCSALAPGGALVVGLEEQVPSELSDLLEPWQDVSAVYRARSRPTNTTLDRHR